MSFTFTVPGPPPKKSGSQSMWATDPDVNRLIALRLAAHATFGAAAPLLGDVRIKLVAHIGPANTRAVGDLDNYVTGVLDGLQCAVGDSWNSRPAWNQPHVAHVRPDLWCAFADDVNVVEIEARKVIGPLDVDRPFYEVTVSSAAPRLGADFPDPSTVRTRDELAAFIDTMRAQFRSDPAGWENTDLDAFLEAAGAWIHCSCPSTEPASWAALAAVLRAGAMYE